MWHPLPLMRRWSVICLPDTGQAEKGNKKKLMTGIEPVTPSLPRKCSTSEPHQHMLTASTITSYNIFFELSRKKEKLCEV